MILFVVAIIINHKRKEGVGIEYRLIIIITWPRGPTHLKSKFIPDHTMHKSIDADMLGEYPVRESH